MGILVFSDLDGTLIEHETYSIDAARPALQRLAEHGIELILNSSKTREEIEAIQLAIGLNAPFVCENGAALYHHLPEAQQAEGHERITFGLPKANWLSRVHELREARGYLFEGFSDWTDEQTREHTGLSLEQAALARRREFSEPILWMDSDEHRAAFLAELSRLDLKMLEGGRFLSIQSDYDKSSAMDWLQHDRSQASPIITVALGDSPNDLAMLERADIAVVVRSDKSDQLNLANPQRIIYTDQRGPQGWNTAVMTILDKLDNGELDKL